MAENETEAAFMASLLGDIGASFFNAVPSPPTSPVKTLPRKRARSPEKSASNAVAGPSTPTRTAKRGKTSQTEENAPTQSRLEAEDEDLDALLNGADDWAWDDMLTPQKVKPSSPRKQAATFVARVAPLPSITSLLQPQARKPVDTSWEPDPCTRCIVETVTEVDDMGRIQKNLVVHVDASDERRAVILRDDWAEADLHSGDIINIVGPFNFPDSVSSSNLPLIILSSRENLLVTHPDHLLIATSVASAPSCMRRPLLNLLVRASSDASPALLWGNLLHSVMEKSLADGRWADADIDKKANEIVQENMGELIRVNVDVPQAKRELKIRASGLREFADKYISEMPKEDAILISTRMGREEKNILAIQKTLDVEEDIWSPALGLRGKIDASVHAIVQPAPIDPAFRKFVKLKGVIDESKTREGSAPFEIKTGRAAAAMEHRAQTMLYTLLLSERTATPVPSGLLYYTQTSEVIEVPAARNEVRGLVTTRNQLAGWTSMRGRKWDTERKGRAQMEALVDGDDLALEKASGEADLVDDGPFLPPPIDDERVCSRCYALDTCMLFRRAAELPPPEASSALADLYERKTADLTSEHAAFFRKWERLIALEEHETNRHRRELWTMDAIERERQGRCFAGMALDAAFQAPKPPTQADQSQVSVPDGEQDESQTLALSAVSATHGIHRTTHRFVRSRHYASPSSTPSLLSGAISAGDPVVVSAEPLFWPGLGYHGERRGRGVLALARGFVLSLTPNEVLLGLDHFLDAQAIGVRMNRAVHGRPDDPVEVIFRIDREELVGGAGRMRDNLAQLFYPKAKARLRELVVDLTPPQFEPAPPGSPEFSREHPAWILNTPQKMALDAALRTQDYALILGMPGTGKTTLIAALIRSIVARKQTVLLASYTHSAVDNVLLKLLIDSFGILRIGNVDKVHPDVKGLTLAGKRPAETIDQLRSQLMTPPVVATTCLSIDHPLFAQRKFDYCIIDEASQITLPACLGPLRFASRFILVGDHHQLPPLVKSQPARTGGLAISLFRRLAQAHPDAVFPLDEQYRMCEDIMSLANRIVYDGRLRCGNDTVAKRSLFLPIPSALECVHEQGRCWLKRVLDPSTKAVFISTSKLGSIAHDTRAGNLPQNVLEVSLVLRLTQMLLRAGISGKELALLSPYRQQNKVLSAGLLDLKEDGALEVEVLTADRAQGRDYEAVVVSLVRANDEGHVGALLTDERRINVALTRARSKLVLVGCARTLRGSPIMATVLDLMEKRGWVHELEIGEELLHDGRDIARRQARELQVGSLAKNLESVLKVRPAVKVEPSMDVQPAVGGDAIPLLGSTMEADLVATMNPTPTDADPDSAFDVDSDVEIVSQAHCGRVKTEGDIPVKMGLASTSAIPGDQNTIIDLTDN